MKISKIGAVLLSAALGVFSHSGKTFASELVEEIQRTSVRQGASMSRIDNCRMFFDVNVGLNKNLKSDRYYACVSGADPIVIKCSGKSCFYDDEATQQIRKQAIQNIIENMETLNEKRALKNSP